MSRTLLAALLFVLGGSEPSWGSLTATTTFNPSGAGSLCGLGVDPATRDVWVYGCSAVDVQRYSTTGTFISMVTRPGESANDVDVELSAKAFTVSATPVPGGSLLFINGESGVAEVYAVDRFANSIIATLTTAFGVGHVVGGAYHPTRKTLFLVQDMVPGAADENRIAEIDPMTGSLLNSFQITATFPVNFGDLDICTATGNLLVASSDETRLAEYSSVGAFVAYHDLPAGVTALSGIGIDDPTGDIWVANTAGNVWRLEGGPCGPAPEVPVLPGITSILLVLLLGASLGARAVTRR